MNTSFLGECSVITGDAKNITDTGAKITGQVTLGEWVPADVKFGVLLSSSSGILYGNAIEVVATEFDSQYRFEVTVKGLEQSTTYFYRTYIYHSGLVKYGEVKPFCTRFATLVDLGLSVKWATCNLGATKPEEYGRYFAYGDVVGQTWNGSSWSGGGFLLKSEYELDANNNLKPEYDAVHVLLGGSWRMPTEAEFRELIKNCTRTWTDDYNGTGVAGRIFTSKKAGYTDKSIFLPAAGYGNCPYLHYADSNGYYWSSSISTGNTILAWGLDLSSTSVYAYTFYRCFGLSIRPVSE